MTETPTQPKYGKNYATVGAFVRGECSGFGPLTYRDDALARNYCCDCDGPCSLLVRPARRCRKFEAALLPVAPIPVAREYCHLFPTAAAVARRFASSHQAHGDRECPGWDAKGCGAPLPKRKRLCESCRDARRRAAYRRKNARRRMPDHS